MDQPPAVAEAEAVVIPVTLVVAANPLIQGAAVPLGAAATAVVAAIPVIQGVAVIRVTLVAATPVILAAATAVVAAIPAIQGVAVIRVTLVAATPVILAAAMQAVGVEAMPTVVAETPAISRATTQDAAAMRAVGVEAMPTAVAETPAISRATTPGVAMRAVAVKVEAMPTTTRARREEDVAVRAGRTEILSLPA